MKGFVRNFRNFTDIALNLVSLSVVAYLSGCIPFLEIENLMQLGQHNISVDYWLPSYVIVLNLWSTSAAFYNRVDTTNNVLIIILYTSFLHLVYYIDVYVYIKAFIGLNEVLFTSFIVKIFFSFQIIDAFLNTIFYLNTGWPNRIPRKPKGQLNR